MKPLLATLLVLIGSVGNAQMEFGALGGAQFGQLKYRERDEGTTADPHLSTSAGFGPGQGWGWHAGTSLLTGKERLACRISLLFLQQRIATSYRIDTSYHALGGGYQSTYSGEQDDLFSTVEMPVQLSIGADGKVRIDIGCSPWVLLAVDHRDRGTKSSEWWTIAPSQGSSTSAYDHHDQELERFSRYGLSAVLSVTVPIMEHFTIGLWGTTDLISILADEEPFSAHRRTVRLSVGYRILDP